MAAYLTSQPNAIDEHAEIAHDTNAPEDHIVKRTPGYISVLKSHGLSECLKKCNIRSLLMCGIATSDCILTSVRAAADEDYVLTVIEDGCKDAKHEVHDVLVKQVFPVPAHVTTAVDSRRSGTRREADSCDMVSYRSPINCIALRCRLTIWSSIIRMCSVTNGRKRALRRLNGA